MLFIAIHPIYLDFFPHTLQAISIQRRRGTSNFCSDNDSDALTHILCPHRQEAWLKITHGIKPVTDTVTTQRLK